MIRNGICQVDVFVCNKFAITLCNVIVNVIVRCKLGSATTDKIQGRTFEKINLIHNFNE